MPSITIRQVPEETHAALVARAAGSGKSLQEYLSAELRRLAARPTVDEWVDTALRRSDQYPRLETRSLIADLDADRE